MAASVLKMRVATRVAKCLAQASRYKGIGRGEATFHFTATNLRVECDNQKSDGGSSTENQDKPTYCTRLALPHDYENVADFMCESYYKHEPVIASVGLGGTTAPPVWRDMMLDEVSAGLSIIAEDQDKCIIGAALNCIAHVNDANRLYCLAERCEKGPIRDIIEFFGYIAEAPKLWDHFCVTGVFEQCSIAVRDDSKNAGVAKRLVLESWLLARDCNYHLFRMDCNNTYCSQIARGFGWSMIWSIPFSQYVKDGRNVFNHVKEPHTTCEVFVDDLRYCKTYIPPYKCSIKATSPQYEK